MPIEILGETYSTEAEFAKELGCSALSLARLRKKGEIGYQRLPGRRGAYYAKRHLDGYLAALCVLPRPREDSPRTDSGQPGDMTASSRETSSECGDGRRLLSDIQRASEILARRDTERKPS